MIWIPVILLASVIGYLKRENLYMLYDTRYWAVAAMVSWSVLMRVRVKVFEYLLSLDLDLCDDIWADVESNSRASVCASKSTDWRDGESRVRGLHVIISSLLPSLTSFRVTSVALANTSSLRRLTLSLHCVSSLSYVKFWGSSYDCRVP